MIRQISLKSIDIVNKRLNNKKHFHRMYEHKDFVMKDMVISKLSMRRTLANFRKFLRRSKNYLDVGCHTGYLTAVFLKTYVEDWKAVSKTATGIDPRTDHIETAKYFFGRRNPYITYLQMDPLTMPFVEEFDVATCCFYLQNIKDKKTIFKNIGRALKKGSHAFIRFDDWANDPMTQNFRYLAQTHPRWQEFFKDVQFPDVIEATQESLMKDIEGTGFTPIVLGRMPIEHEFVGRADLIPWFQGKKSCPALPETMKKKDIDEFYIDLLDICQFPKQKATFLHFGDFLYTRQTSHWDIVLRKE